MSHFLSGAASTAAFWAKVDKSGTCWLWHGTLSANGYGKVTRRGEGKRTVSAHRFSYQLAHGSIPKGKFVCHKCDMPACVRPDHLFLGTNRQNVLDAKKKGRLAVGKRSGAYTHPERRPRGENHGRALFTQKRVEWIRELSALGASAPLLAHLLDVQLSQIQRIISGQHWGDGYKPCADCRRRPRMKRGNRCRLCHEIVRRLRLRELNGDAIPDRAKEHEQLRVQVTRLLRSQRRVLRRALKEALRTTNQSLENLLVLLRPT